MTSRSLSLCRHSRPMRLTRRSPSKTRRRASQTMPAQLSSRRGTAHLQKVRITTLQPMTMAASRSALLRIIFQQIPINSSQSPILRLSQTLLPLTAQLLTTSPSMMTMRKSPLTPMASTSRRLMRTAMRCQVPHSPSMRPQKMARLTHPRSMGLPLPAMMATSISPASPKARPMSRLRRLFRLASKRSKT